MGIKNLKKIFDQYCNSAIQNRNLDQYAGLKLGIDVSIFLYKNLYNGGDIIDGFTRMILRLTRNNITPLFIFDGKPPKEKDGILQERREKKDYLNIKKSIIEYTLINKSENYDIFLKEIMDIIHFEDKDRNVNYRIDEDEIKELFEKNKDQLLNDYDKTTKKIIYVTDEHIILLKKLFDLFGVKYIHEQCEADLILATLYKNGTIDGCISEDMDLLANGCKILLRNFNSSSPYVTEYCLTGILELLNLSYDEFIDMCILCGCDYTTKIKGIGHVQAYKNIVRYRNIESVIEELPIKTNIPDDFNYVRSRELFKQIVNENIMKNIQRDYCMTKPDINGLISFLSDNSDQIKSETIIIISTQLINNYLNISYFNISNDDDQLNKEITVIDNDEINLKKDEETTQIINYDKSSLLLNIMKNNKQNEESNSSNNFIEILNMLYR